MSNGIYDILGKLNGVQPKENPVSMSAEPIYESIDPQDITPAVNNLEEKYQNFLSEEKAKKSQNQKDAAMSRGEPEIVKLIHKARLERPTSTSDTEALAYQMVKANKELEKATAANDEQEKKIADLTAKVSTLPTAEPVVEPLSIKPTPSAIPPVAPTATPAQVQAEPAVDQLPTLAREPDTAQAPATQAEPAVTKTYKPVTGKKPAVGTPAPEEQPKIDPAQAVVEPEEELPPNVVKGKFGKSNAADPLAALTGTYGESVNKGKNMLKENIQMLTEYKEGDPQLALINWNTLIDAWKKRMPKVDLDFGGRPLTIWKDQMYAILSEFAADQNAERRMQRVEDVLASHDATVQFLMLPRVKKFINQYPQFEKNDPVLKAAKAQQKELAKQGQYDMFSGSSKLPPGSRQEMQENLGNDTMQENIKTNSILEGVRQVEDKKLKEGAKPDFLDLDKDGDTEEPMKSAAKSAKDDEPAKPDSDAVAKRKRLQALKDKQEDERAEKGDDYKSATRFVKGRAYGGSAQKDDEEKELDEVAPPGAKAERMVKHIKKGYSKDGNLSKREKGIAYATAWKAHNKGQVEEGTNFGDTIKNSEGKMTKVKVTEGKDAIRNHPIYTTKEAWDHYAQELAEQETMEQAVMTPVVDVQQELAEIASLAGLTYESKCSSCGCADCKCQPLDEAATRKDFRMVADLIKQIPDASKRKELAHHHSGIFKQQNPRFKHDVFCKACGVDECDYNMGVQPAAVIVGEMDAGFAEGEMDEGNEFTKARLDAIAHGADTFTVGGKTHSVTGDTSDEKSQVEESKKTVTEDINVNITANGEQDALNLLRKLSGMAEVPQVTGVAIPMGEEQATCEACGMIPCGCDESVEEERDIELANTPHEKVAPINAVTTDAGGGLGGPKKQYPLAANRGANPLEERVEESIWAAYESMINDVKA